jgi:hypothetical protein
MTKEAVVMIILSQDGKRVVVAKRLSSQWHIPGEGK